MKDTDKTVAITLVVELNDQMHEPSVIAELGKDLVIRIKNTRISLNVRKVHS